MQREAFELLARVVPRLPAAFTRPAATLAGGVIYRALPAFRASAQHNIGILLGLPPEHPAVRRAALGACCTLARNYVDMLALPHWSAEELRQRTEVIGLEHLREALERGRGAVGAVAHLGNVDVGGNALLARGIRCAVLTEVVKPDWLFQFFVRERSHFGGVVVPFTPGVLPQLQRLLKDGVALGIACDWDMQGNGIPVAGGGTPGHALRIPAGIGMLAIRAKAPIVPVLPLRLPDGRIQVTIEPEVPVPNTGDLRADLREVSHRVAQRLLPRLRAHPEQWVLFHRVWDAVETGP